MNAFNVAWLSLTYLCNNRCRWCYAASNDYDAVKQKTLDPAREDGILELLSAIGIKRITLIGGEPSLYPNLENLMHKISLKGLNAGIVTNGRCFKNRDFVRKLRQAGLKNATFSIEGPPKIHDYTTQVSGSFYEVMLGIENAINEKMEISTNTVISTINKDCLESLTDSLTGKGIKHMGFNLCGVCMAEEDNNKYGVEYKLAIPYFEKAYRYAKTKGINVRLVTPIPFCNVSKSLLDCFKKEKVIGQTPCQLSHGRNFVVDYNGDIVPCTHLTGFPLFNIFDGNQVIKKAEFLDRYNSESAKDFREAMSKYASQKCTGCKEPCAGGCPLFWTKYDPDTEIRGRV